MKKSGILIALSLSITLVNAKKPNESLMLEKLNLKPIETVFDDQMGKIDKETQALRVQRNEYFKSEIKEASEIVLSYLQARRDVFGITLDNIKLVKSSKSSAGEYFYYRQYIRDIPVYATNFIVYVNKDNVVTYALNEFRNLDRYGDVAYSPSVNNNSALEIAYKYLNMYGNIAGEPKTELIYFESIDRGLELAWKINTRGWQIFVSAEIGRIIHAEETRMSASGNGKIFRPNPLVSAGVSYGGCYSHNYGANNSCLKGQLVQVTLNDITFENGRYKLKGPYCVIEDIN